MWKPVKVMRVNFHSSSVGQDHGQFLRQLTAQPPCVRASYVRYEKSFSGDFFLYRIGYITVVWTHMWLIKYKVINTFTTEVNLPVNLSFSVCAGGRACVRECVCLCVCSGTGPPRSCTCTNCLCSCELCRLRSSWESLSGRLTASTS